MNLEELKQWTTDRLDYEDNEIGKEHSEYRGHYYAGVLALLAKLEAAQRLRLCIKAWIESVPEYSQLAKNLEEALAAFDKEQS